MPDESVLGKRRHWFSKPSSKGFKLPGIGGSLKDETAILLDQKLAFANQKASNFVLNNGQLVPTIKKMHDVMRQTQSESELFSAFRMVDVNSTGLVTKDDFTNIIFDCVKQVKPSNLMHLVTAFVESEGDQDVKYEDFFHLISRNGEVDGIESQYKQMSAAKMDPLAGARPSERSMRDAIEKLKNAVTLS